MDFNGINNSYSSYEAASVSAKSASGSRTSTTKDASGNTGSTTSSSAYSEVAATYEASSGVHTKKSNSAIVAQLKADTQARMAQMQSLVTKMFQKQGTKIGAADDMWKMLAGGNFTADAGTIAQAKEDISENGYWGVSQTSERIFSFALALSGGDSDKMEEMVKAVEKGFSEATRAWGRKLPSITDDTHSSIMDKFDNWFKENDSSATTEDILK